jgi:4-amino-4-deoxy-L-arabinose transferase-like glycosyltransferase
MVNRLILFYKQLSERQRLLLLLVVAFGLRLYAVLAAKGIANDGACYGFMARDFLEGDFSKGLSTPFHPFYPLLISLISFDSTHVEMAGRLISFLFGTLTLIPLYYFVKETWGEKEAMWMGLFYSFHPYLVTYSGMMLSEATYWGVLTLSVFLFWMGLVKGRVFLSIVSGFFLGFAYLTRPEGIGYLFVFVVWAVIYGGIRKTWLKKVGIIIGLLCSVLVLSGPYMLFIHNETGRWLISKKALEAQTPYVIWIEGKQNPPNSANLQRGEAEPADTEVVPKNEPVQRRFHLPVPLHNVIRYLPFTTYHYLRAYHFMLWPFLFFGLIRRRKGKTRVELFLASLVIFHLVSLATFIPSMIRFSVPVVALSLAWAGAGVLELNRLLTKRGILEPVKWISLLILLVLIVQLPQSLRPERRHREDQKKTGVWLKQNTPEGAIIMSNSPQEAFYADREFIALPARTSVPQSPGTVYRGVMDFARKNRVGYILVNGNTRDHNPDFFESIRSTELTERYKHIDQSGNSTIVYEMVY